MATRLMTLTLMMAMVFGACSDTEDEPAKNNINNTNNQEAPTSTRIVLKNEGAEAIFTGNHLLKIGMAEDNFFTWNFPCDPDLCGECLPGEPPSLEALASGEERATSWGGYIYEDRVDGCVPRTVAAAGTYTAEWCYGADENESTATTCVSAEFTLGEEVVLVKTDG